MSDPNNPHGPSDPYGAPGSSNPYGNGGSYPPPPPGQGSSPYGSPGQPGYGQPYGQGPGQPPYGAPPGQGGFGTSGGSTPTDGVSIASLVLSVLCCTGLIGIILGIVGLGRTKNGQRKGRWAAVSGIVIGVLSLFVVGGVVLFGFVLANTVVTPGNAEAGQCVDIDEDAGTVVMTKAECADEHDGEIVGVEEITDANQGDVEAGIVEYCGQVLSADDLATIQADSSLELSAVIEDPDDVTVGDTLICYVEGDDLTAPVL